MKILFCNIAYMNRYTGNIEDDIPQGGGAWVKEHKDAHEKWNFLNVNGNCYGFVMNKSDQFHIERFDGVSRQDAMAEDVTVVWCARTPGNQEKETVIVGWYEHATVYRFYQESACTPFGLDRSYFVEANADDCYLLPEGARNYVIGRAAVLGTGKGFGQSNFWYADSDYAKENIVPEVLSYLQTSKALRINHTNDHFLPPVNLAYPLTEKEDSLASEYFDNGEYMKFLPLGYRAYQCNLNADSAYYLATALKELHQYSAAIEWFGKVIELEGDSWETTQSLPYLMMECGKYADAIAVSENLLNFPESSDILTKHQIFSILADCHYNLGDTAKAVSWLDHILAESSDAELIEHTKKVKEFFMEC